MFNSSKSFSFLLLLSLTCSVFLVNSLPLSSSSLSSSSQRGSCRPGCQIDSSGRYGDIASCEEYKTNDWLPPNYVGAASCACSKLPPAAKSNSSSCVRNKIHQYTFNTSVTTYINHTYRAQLREWREKYCERNPKTNTTGPWCAVKYHELVVGSGFGDITHSFHVRAFEECCCFPNSGGKNYGPENWTFYLVEQFAYYFGTKLFCPVEIDLIELVGKCGCQGW